MRLSRRVSLLGRRENRILKKRSRKKKHKKLDDICETAYNLNHNHPTVEETKNNNVVADVDNEAELRRSTRVRRAPVVLDASPSPAKKRRRVVEFRREKDESGSWGDRLRGRAKKGKRRPRKKLFDSDDVLSSVVKSKRRCRVRRVVLKNAHLEEREGSSSDEGQSRDSSEDDKVESGGSDHENKNKKNEVEKGDDTEESEEGTSEAEIDEEETSESEEDGEENEKNEIENHIGQKEDVRDSSESDEEGETSESDEHGEESEKNEIENHIGKKEEMKDSSGSDEEEGETSESEEDGEESEKNEIKDHLGKNEDMRDSSESDEEEGEEEDEDKESLKGGNEVRNDEENDEVVVLEDVEEEEVEDNGNKETDEDERGSDNLEKMELDVQVELQNSIADGENEMDSLNVGGVPTGQIEIEKSNEKHLEDENVKKSSHDTNERRILRVGRRCGLCGTGNSGKPPKTLVEDGNGSDHEVAYSGSSASEDVRYDTCDGFGADPGWLGRLLGPINDRHGIAGIFVHQHCAVWSPEVYFAGLNCLKNVRAALFRGRVLKCTRCRRPGATIGCRVDRCPKTYHLPCARANGCIFYHKKFLIACTDHRHLFQPHGVQYLQKLKKMKTKKLKLEMRKVSGDAWRKDHDAEEKYLENCGEDEEFLKRESKRLHRDLLRIAPVYIGGSSSDKESQFQGWESVAGLQNVIQSLKEVVILPLLYPEFFSNMGLTPPRGVLLHGYPGTGKTLVVRALIGSCAQGDKRIAYFARKGADCLGKYVGDAERQLRLLFQVAEKSQPSIIFFDEIDGLAPCRTRQQDQTHNSVVSTLLALMDGLKSRGSVVVIGATNRPDSVDPALRRPGRFDREIYFPLPSTQDREAILSLHTRKWPKPVTGSLLKQISRRTVGFAGADLQSLCTQAAITALRRSCPFQEILSAAEKNGPLGKHPSLPNFVVEERDWLEALRHAPPPCSQRGTEMAANDVNSSPLHTHLIPCLLQPLSVFLASLCHDKRIWLPCPLYKAVMLVKSVVVSALDEPKIPGHNWWSHVQEMLLKVDVLRDVEIKLSRCGIINGQASYSSSNVGNEKTDDNKLESHCSQQISTRPNLWKNATCGSEKKVGFWLLISGSPRSGQRYLASCLLHCFTGNVEIVKLDSATISQEGQGDLMLGVTRILMRCASVGSSLIFMPRIDLWAIETYVDNDGDESDSSTKNSELLGQKEDKVSEMATSEDVSQKTSVIWGIFVEQVESISVTSSLTILATSALPSEALPDGIKQFFKSGKPNNRSSSPLEETIPRFSIPLDGQFNHDSVINSSTTELSKDLVQQFVQLTHQRVHVHSSSSRNVKGCDTFKRNADNHRPTNEAVREQFPESSFTQFSSPANSRPSKGKSSLLLIIATLGYQILRYPHFAELCWATSKLKEGPCTNTRGPWKGWPFNSCIIRPDKSSENVEITSSSSHIKSKEIYGSVRGLIAVGLSAYRGMYTTVREVSSEVRKVLELLADKINAKIRAGKDPYQYIRLLSQMAYFEDVVNSWAYSLQSFEENSQATIPPTSGLKNLKSRDNKPFEDMAEKKAGYELDVYVKISEDTTEQKDECEPAKNSEQMLEKSTQNLDLNEPMEEDNQNSVGKIFANKPPVQIMLCQAIPDMIQHNGNNPDPCTAKTSENHPSDNGVCAPIMPNGFANTETVVIKEADLCSGDSGTENPSTFKGFSNQHSETTQEANIVFENGNSSYIDGGNNVESNSLAGNESSLSNGSMVICFYRCCSECLIKLRETIGKIIIYEWGLRDDGDFTVENVHDLVASVSMNLHSSLRKIFAAEWDKGEDEMKQNNFRGVFENEEKDACQCKGSEDGFTRPKECRCHSTTNHIPQLENDLKFVCRGDVMSQLNPGEVTSLNFHCKFETICLCSLIEWIVMTKQPSS